MTVPSTTNKIIYTGNGAVSVYAYPFKIYADSDLVVTRVTILTGIETILALTTDYTVSGAGDENGGDVTLVAGNLSALYKLVIQRKLPLTQETEYVENDPLPAKQLEEDVDRLMMICQQQQEELDRSVKVGLTETNDQSVDEIFNEAVSDAQAAQEAAETANTSAQSAKTAAEAARDAALAVAAAYVPTGVYFPYGGTTAPSSAWLLCDGSAVSRTTYAALFAVIGTAYGAGNGSTTFNVPDMRDRFPLGKGTTFSTLGATGGAATKDISHTHTVSGTTGAPNSGTVNVDGSSSPVAGSSHTHNFSATSGSGGSASQDVMNPYQVGNYIIKT